MGLPLKARQNKATMPAMAISNRQLIALNKPKNKFNAKKTTCGAGHRHDSMKEAYRCEELRRLEKAGKIEGLQIHPRYTLEVYHAMVCTYEVDFVYQVGERTVIEDVKGVKTAIYKLKKKLMKAIYGIEIFET